MARARTDEPADEPTDVVLDALDLLTRDHRLVEELFAGFNEAAAQQLDPLARRTCKMLRVHTQIEEEIFYPAARRALAEDTLIETAEREHADAKQSIMRLEAMTSDHDDFMATMTLLAQQVTGHVAEEEKELFPRVRSSGIDLVALGLALAERREILLEVLGLHDDDQEGAANQRDLQQRGTPAGRSEESSGQSDDAARLQ